MHDPQVLSDRLLPLFASLLERKVAQAPEEVIRALAPIIDRAIARKSQTDKLAMSQALAAALPGAIAQQIDTAPEEVIQALAPIIDQAITCKSQTDKTAMSLALAAALPGALSKQIGDAPEEVIQAIAPIMGRALHEQVRLERDAMVDALYPVIGNTISKYMGEVVRQINQRVEETFSIRGIYRKLNARLRGISEAELILSEALPFTVQAVFLIHKTSGLVVVEIQREDGQALEADMLAGMLTAIRSFASECTVNPEKTSELTEIDYDDFKIVMEVAGYCYIAAVTQGDPPAGFATQLRQTLSAIILNYGYGELIAEFDGDPDSIPQAVVDLIENLLRSPEVMLPPQRHTTENHETWRSRSGVIASWAVLLGLLMLPFVLYSWQQARRQQLADRVTTALDANPNLTVYQLDATVKGREVRLQGQLPNEILSQQAATTATAALPAHLNVVNEIQMVNPPPDPGAIQAEVARLTQTFNQMQGIQVGSRYDHETNRVIVEGSIHQGQDARTITQAFEQIPGVDVVVLMLATAQTPIQRRIYFDTNSNFIDPYDLESKLMPIRSFLNQYPDLQLQIIGHTDRSGSEQRNLELAPQRAAAVRQALVAQGIAADRLKVTGSTQPPPNVRLEDPLWLSRIVRFEQIAPAGAN
ncbi:MAG: OmpA family protein [Spirulinaceae cyanobacterium RM2_2_10]|nr:OmpA family protein [Spirulinaceae cyanobacterium RM2_2_10]